MPMKDETSSSHITRSLSLPAVVCLILGPGSQIVYERPTALSKYKMPYALLGPFLLIGHYSDISLGLKSVIYSDQITACPRLIKSEKFDQSEPLRDCAH
ncbi:hypothetical protein PGT21_023293 [Puccinia graminis f. sp. tritici]|uniref:Uncharacterized protein n=1 Tax=Puccinia graminis f. sp. tritici TaxID=56615 RepID=A0A5B0R1M8_PUCGR|nr:hypothetical protein PGT21_023293 [Puccinia graminis f. sp. tritici]